MQLGTQQGITSHDITTISNIREVHCGTAHTLIRTQSDKLYCCGYNGKNMNGKKTSSKYLPLQELDFPKQNTKQRITNVLAALYSTVIAIGT